MGSRIWSSLSIEETFQKKIIHRQPSSPLRRRWSSVKSIFYTCPRHINDLVKLKEKDQQHRPPSLDESTAFFVNWIRGFLFCQYRWSIWREKRWRKIASLLKLDLVRSTSGECARRCPLDKVVPSSIHPSIHFSFFPSFFLSYSHFLLRSCRRLCGCTPLQTRRTKEKRSLVRCIFSLPLSFCLSL